MQKMYIKIRGEKKTYPSSSFSISVSFSFSVSMAPSFFLATGVRGGVSLPLPESGEGLPLVGVFNSSGEASTDRDPPLGFCLPWAGDGLGLGEGLALPGAFFPGWFLAGPPLGVGGAEPPLGTVRLAPLGVCCSSLLINKVSFTAKRERERERERGQ